MCTSRGLVFCVVFVLPFGCKNDGNNHAPRTTDYSMPFSNNPVPIIDSKAYINIRCYENNEQRNEVIEYDFSYQKATALDIPIGPVSAIGISPNSEFIAYEDRNSQDTVVEDFSGNFYGTENSGPWEKYVWTSDSRYVYYGDYFNGIYEIDTLNKTGRIVIYSEYSTYDHNIAISPDNAYIVWSHHEYGINMSLYLALRESLPSNIREASLLYSGKTGWDEKMNTVFLDNDRFMFKARTYETGNGVSNIYVYDLRERKAVRVLSADYIGFFQLSPDKQYIVYSGEDSSFNGEVSVFIAQTGSWEKRIVDQFVDRSKGTFLIGSLEWSLDSKYFLLLGSFVLRPINILLYSLDEQEKWKVFEFLNESSPCLNWLR